MKPEISEKGILNLGRHVLLEEAKELEGIAKDVLLSAASAKAATLHARLLPHLLQPDPLLSSSMPQKPHTAI